MKFYKLVFVILFAISNFAQTPQQIEQQLLTDIENLRKVSSYSGNYDEVKTPQAQEVLRDNLLKYTKTAATLKYGFPKLKDVMEIATSPDGKLRIYSWNTEDGGTMRNFDKVYQYQGANGKVYSYGQKDGFEFGAFVPQIYELNTRTGRVYLALTYAIGSTQDHAQSVYALRIKGNTLDEQVKIFKTASGLTHSIGFAFNFFSVSERKERPLVLIPFDSKTNVLKIPIVIENQKFPNGEVTNKFINYKFNGTNFVKVK